VKALEIIKLILEVIAILISLGILRWAQWRYKHFKNNRELYRKLQTEKDKQLMLEIKSIKDEVKPNGGISLNDKVTDIAKHLIVIDGQLVDLKIGQRNSLDLMDIAYWESDNSGRVTYVSVAMCEIIGCTQIDILDSSWMGLIDSVDRDRVSKEWGESVKYASEFNCTYNYKRPDGTFQKVQAIAIHHKNNSGRVEHTKGKIIKLGEPFKK
jgi:PAS domain S-box-containing protein